ncbi:MAG: hypothetical protein H6Q73_3608 [Firmicutes bacterium]|nr:hypothetical protein [Bacillota bacterium]
MRGIVEVLKVQQGQALIEYVPILAFVSIIALVILGVIGMQANNNIGLVIPYFP